MVLADDRLLCKLSQHEAGELSGDVSPKPCVTKRWLDAGGPCISLELRSQAVDAGDGHRPIGRASYP